MKSSRILNSNKLLLPAICLAVVLRSMVAPGFMLTVDDDAPLGFNFTLCESMDTGDGLLPAHSHDQDLTGSKVDPHQHSTNSSLSIDTGCCDWCGVSKFLFVVDFNHDQFFKESGATANAYAPVITPRKAFLYTVRVRAPPVSLFIS